jgi:snurportin-1
LLEGVGPFVPLLEPYRPAACPSPDDHDIEPNGKQKGGRKKGRNKRKGRKGEGGGSKPNKYAEKCMYAELLEMNGDEAWLSSSPQAAEDGLPQDLESGWVAVGPVPIGKRCLAVTHQSSGIAGVGEFHCTSTIIFQ